MARPTNTEARRSQITGALRRVMARQGYEGASVAGIGPAARLTPGLVHYHFASNLEVLLGLLDGLAATPQVRLAAALEAAGPAPPARLAAFVDFHLSLQFADADALACWITLSGEALREPRVRRRYREVVAAWCDALTKVVSAGIRSRDFRAKDAT